MTGRDGLKRPKRVRLRVRYQGHKWYALVVDAADNELDRSPPGDERDAEHYMETYRRIGAWRRS